jgi:hypothetical protein
MNKEQRNRLIGELACGTANHRDRPPALIPASPGWRVVIEQEPEGPIEVGYLAVHMIAAWLRDDLGQLKPLLFDEIGQVFVVAKEAGGRVVALIAPGESTPFEVPEIYRSVDLPTAEPSVQ